MCGENLAFLEREEVQPLDFLHIRRFSEVFLTLFHLSHQLWGVDIAERNFASAKIFCYTENANSYNYWMYKKNTLLALGNFGKKTNA